MSAVDRALRHAPGPPDADAMGDLPVHVVVRDFPETLAVFRRFGVDLAERGADPVRDAVDADPAPLVAALLDATGWRRGAGAPGAGPATPGAESRPAPPAGGS